MNYKLKIQEFSVLRELESVEKSTMLKDKHQGSIRFDTIRWLSLCHVVENYIKISKKDNWHSSSIISCLADRYDISQTNDIESY